MSDEDIRRDFRAALEQAATALETAESTNIGLARMRKDFDRFVDRLPEELAALGFLRLDKPAYDTLLARIAEWTAKDLLARLQERRAGWWNQRWARWAAVATVAGFWLTLIVVAVSALDGSHLRIP